MSPHVYYLSFIIDNKTQITSKRSERKNDTKIFFDLFAQIMWKHLHTYIYAYLFHCLREFYERNMKYTLFK